MNSIRSIHAVDTHTMGEPTRIIIGGIPKIPGHSMADKKAFLETQMDHIRTSTMHEPRGHSDMFGSIITSPCHDEADFGIIFMDSGGYLNMCGHGSIGAATMAVETGMVTAIEPITEILMDAPAGLVKARALVVGGKVKEVSIVNVPSFLYKKDVSLHIPELGDIHFDIAFGGSFFAIIHASQLKIKVDPSQIDAIKAIGIRLRRLINENIPVVHPTLSHINRVDLIEIFEESNHPDAPYKNVVIFGNGQIDRSPCGTGTSAKMATLFAKGLLAMDQTFVYESILGTVFKGRVIGVTQVGDYPAIIPEITGSAYITGFNHFVINPDDPVKYGFSL
jgi:proline racemase